MQLGEPIPSFDGRGMAGHWRATLWQVVVVMRPRADGRAIPAFVSRVCGLATLIVFASVAAAEDFLAPALPCSGVSSIFLVAADMAAAESGEHSSRTLHGRPYEQPFGDKTEFLWWSPQLFFWTLLLFLSLWYILGLRVWKPMLQALEERDRRIQESLAMAEKLRDEAQSITQTMDEDIVQAQQAARAALDQARAEASQEVATMMAKARQEQAETLHQARQSVDRAVERGKTDIEKTARSLGAGIAENLIGVASGDRP